MTDEGWIRRRAAIVRELDFPEPFDLAEFADRLGRRRGRPLRQPKPALVAGRITGIVIRRSGRAASWAGDPAGYARSAMPELATGRRSRRPE